MTATEERYAAMEAEAEAKRRSRAGRQMLVLLGLVNALVLGTGLTAMVDLRRLATPGGTALRWTQSAVFGDCDDYLRYSTALPDAGDPRSTEQLCRDLRKATKAARVDSIRIGLRLGEVREDGSRAEVEVLLTRYDKSTHVTMTVTRVDGQWRVVRDAQTCALVGCA